MYNLKKSKKEYNIIYCDYDSLGFEFPIKKDLFDIKFNNIVIYNQDISSKYVNTIINKKLLNLNKKVELYLSGDDDDSDDDIFSEVIDNIANFIEAMRLNYKKYLDIDNYNKYMDNLYYFDYVIKKQNVINNQNKYISNLVFNNINNDLLDEVEEIRGKSR